MKKLYILFAFALAAPMLTTAQSVGGIAPCSELFISEYVEGWDNNKALELYNPTANAIALAGYKLERYVNGDAFPSGITLTGGVVQPYSTFVIVLDKRDPNGTGFEEPIWAELEAAADTFVCPVFVYSTSALYFNGNDAVSLTSPSNQVVDVFGRIGEDPGVAWSDQNGTWWTSNHTLIRKSSIQQGDVNGYDVFMPQVEWDSLPANTFSNLGTHVSSCFSPPCSSPATVAYTGLNTSYTTSDPPTTLIGSPAGGVFFGQGVDGNEFNPAFAGLGNHSVVYTYVDENGCIGSYGLCTTVDLNVGFGGTEIASTEGLDVYPNPSNGRFNLEVDGFDGVVSYTVYDAYGKEVGFDSFVANGLTNNSIDLSDLAIGAYTLQVQTSKGLFAEKLIKE